MNSDSTRQIIEALKPLADKLGQGGSHIYEVYARQMFAEGVAGLALIGFGWILFIAFFTFSWKRTEGFKEADEGIQFFCNLICSLSLVALIASTMIGGFISVTKLINPEYAAIHRIIEDVRGPSN